MRVIFSNRLLLLIWDLREVASLNLFFTLYSQSLNNVSNISFYIRVRDRNKVVEPAWVHLLVSCATMWRTSLARWRVLFVPLIFWYHLSFNRNPFDMILRQLRSSNNSLRFVNNHTRWLIDWYFDVVTESFRPAWRKTILWALAVSSFALAFWHVAGDVFLDEGWLVKDRVLCKRTKIVIYERAFVRLWP